MVPIVPKKPKGFLTIRLGLCDCLSALSFSIIESANWIWKKINNYSNIKSIKYFIILTPVPSSSTALF